MGALGTINSNLESRTRANEFISACRYLLLAKGPGEAKSLAQQYGASRGVIDCLDAVVKTKTAVSPGTTADGTWASPLVGVSYALSRTLAGLNVFDSIWQAGAFQRFPMKTNVTAITLGATAATPGESSPKVISRFSLSRGPLEPTKSECTIVVSSEVARLSTDAALIWLSEQVRTGIAQETDRVFVETIIADGAIDSVTASGPSLDDFNHDLATAMVLLNLGANSKPYLLLPPKVMKVAAFMRGSGGSPAYPQLNVLGGSIAGIPVLPSNSLTNTIIALDASQIAADLGPIIPERAEQASLQFDDDPSSGEQQTISLWQSNLVALRLERYWAFRVLNSDACVKIEGTTIDQGTGT
jgi:hypothetical protein